MGAGGTMRAEAGLLGIPTVSYNSVPNPIMDYWFARKCLQISDNPSWIINYMQIVLSTKRERKPSEILSLMEDPITKLEELL